MRIEILKTDKRLGIKAGETYEAKGYWLDPGKFELISRVPDGYDPCCTQYKCDVKVLGSDK